MGKLKAPTPETPYLLNETSPYAILRRFPTPYVLRSLIISIVRHVNPRKRAVTTETLTYSSDECVL